MKKNIRGFLFSADIIIGFGFLIALLSFLIVTLVPIVQQKVEVTKAKINNISKTSDECVKNKQQN